MNINLKMLSDLNIIKPANAIRNNANTILHIIIFDRKVELISIKEYSLVFFPTRKDNISLNTVDYLYNNNSYAVLYSSVFKLLKGNYEKYNNIFIVDDDSDMIGAISECYNMENAEINHLLNYFSDTMDRLSYGMMKNSIGDENVFLIASSLLGEKPIAVVPPNFFLYKNYDSDKQHIIKNYYFNNINFDWHRILNDFNIDKAKKNSDLFKNSAFYIETLEYKNDYCTRSEIKALLYPINDDSLNKYGYLIVIEKDSLTTLPMEDCIKIKLILSALKFEAVKSNEIANTINRYYDFILSEIIESNETDFRKIMNKYGLVKKVIADRYYISIISRNQTKTNNLILNELLTSQQFNALYDKISSVYNNTTFFLFERKNRMIVFIPESFAEKTKSGEVTFSKLINVLYNYFGNLINGIGISDITNVTNMREGYMQASMSLSISEKGKERNIVYYRDLGIMRYFFDNKDDIDFRPLLDLYNEYIAPIVNYDKAHDSALIDTLECYINSNSSPSLTVSELFIHKNTLYSRLNRIEHLINKSLSQSETIFNLSLGLKIKKLADIGIIKDI